MQNTITTLKNSSHVNWNITTQKVLETSLCDGEYQLELQFYSHLIDGLISCRVILHNFGTTFIWDSFDVMHHVLREDAIINALNRYNEILTKLEAQDFSIIPEITEIY